MKEKNLSDEIITRLHIAYGIAEKRGSLKELGAAIGVSGSVISGWRERGVPDEKIADATIETSCNRQWIKTGEGEMNPLGQDSIKGADPSGGVVSGADLKEDMLAQFDRLSDKGQRLAAHLVLGIFLEEEQEKRQSAAKRKKEKH